MENKKYEKALISQANLQNTFYNYTNSLQPCAYFWKQLVKGKQTPQLLVPDTLLLNDKETPLIWIYTNSKGKLQKSSNINLKDFVNKITNYCSPNQLAATLKRVTFNDNYINGNDVKLLNARYLQNASFQQLGGQNQTLITIQRYVKSNGNNPFICRTIWRRDRRSQCFIVTSKKSYFDENEPESKRFLVKVGESQKFESTSRIVKAIQGKHLTETGKYLQNITNFMKVYRGIDMSEIVGDFIKDEAGNWWLINIKAFQTDSKIIKNPQSMLENGENDEEVVDDGLGEKYEKEKYQKTKICRYCEKSYLESDLSHYMTIKMLIETDRYLLHLGKSYKWLRRSDIMNVDTHCLYQEHKICERCYRLYMEIQQLMEVENQFLKSMGFIMQKKPKQLLMSLTNQQELKTESKNKQLLILASCFENSRNSAESNNNNASFSNSNASYLNNNNVQNFSLNKSKPILGAFPKTIELGPNSNIIFDDNNVPIKNDHMINKMIRYRFILYFKEIDQLQLPYFLQHQQHLNYHFYIEYQLFNIKNKIKLDFINQYNPIKNTLQIKKLKLNYFFSHSPQDVHQYLNSLQQDFHIKIYAEHKNLKGKNFDSTTTKTLSVKMKTSQKFNTGDNQSTFERSPNKRRTEKKYTIMKNTMEKDRRVMLGKLSLSVTEFLGSMLSTNGGKICKKDFYKFFSVNQVPHGWGLQGSIGIIPSESFVSTSRMIFFSEDHLIYLPSDNYYFCEHLPEQWIDVVKKELTEMSNKSSNDNSSNKLNNDNSESVVIQNGQREQDPVEQQQESEKDSQRGSLNFKDQIKLLLNQHSISSQSLASSIPQNINNLFNPKIKIEDQSQTSSIQKESPITPNKLNPTDSWKNFILKDQILNYQKSTNKTNQKLSKKSSKSKLFPLDFLPKNNS